MKSISAASLLCLMLIATTLAAGQARQAPAVDLADTSWQLVKIQSGDGKTYVPDDKAKYTLSLERGGRVSARIDCNRGSGTWKSTGPNQLQFGVMAVTRVACPPASLHDRVAKDLPLVRSYTMKDGHLFLSLLADGGIYDFEPVRPPAAALQPRVESRGPITYECSSTTRGGIETLTATFYQTSPAMVLLVRANQARPAFQVPAASGVKYEGQDVTLWEARGEAQVTWSSDELKCKPSVRSKI